MLVRPRTSCRKRLVFVHAASETPDTNVQAVAEELQRVKSKVDQQSILLQELLRNKEPVEPAAAETVQKPAQEVGVLETDYFDMKVRKPAGPYEKETPVREVGTLYMPQKSWRSVSIRSLPMEKVKSEADEYGRSIYFGIELCLDGYNLRPHDSKQLSLPCTIKKGSVMRMEMVTPPFHTHPVKLQLGHDVVGSLGHDGRLQCLWRAPMTFFADDSRRRLLTLLPGSWRPDGYHRATKYDSQYESQWRVSFELMWEVGEAA